MSATLLLRDAKTVARALLGSYLVSSIGGRTVGGRIVETEAYLGLPDPASHAARRIGRTSRNDPMFGPSGTAYVYFIYGVHWCFNVVTSSEGEPHAVLIRALQPIWGEDLMRERRGRPGDLTNGPARLCQALAIDGSLNRHPLHRAPVRLLAGRPVGDDEIRVSGRIGIRLARDWPLRFFVNDDRNVSRARAPDPASPSVLP